MEKSYSKRPALDRRGIPASRAAVHLGERYQSPIYCDNRLTLTAPEVRKHVEAGLAEIVRTKFPEAEVLMGTSTAGIAHAAITATILDLPMGYVRSGAKDHGRGNRIEGRLEKGQKVVVIEDLISTAGSCIEVVERCAKRAPRCWAWRRSSPTGCRRGSIGWRRPES